MNLTVVTGSLSRKAGGLFHSVRHCAQETYRSSSNVSVIGIRDEFTELDIKHWSPIEPVVLGSVGPSRLGLCPGILSELKAAPPTIVHVHGVWEANSYLVMKYCLENRVPYVVSPRGMLDPWALGHSKWRKQVSRWAFVDRYFKNASCVHALNESEYQSIRAFGFRGPVAIIPNGVSLPELRVPPKRRVSNTGKKSLLFIGRYHEKKGLLHLLAAWALLRNLNREVWDGWRIQLHGWDDGGHESELISFVRENNLEESVSIGPPVLGDDKVAALSSASAFILPSYSEGLPISILEAWAYGLPVFMTEACNLPIGFEKRAAIKIDNDPNSIAISMARSLACASLDDIGVAGRTLAADNFAWQKIGAQLNSMYKWMLDPSEHPSFVNLD